MDNIYSMVLLPVIWIHFVVSMATMRVSPKQRWLKFIRYGLFVLTVAGIGAILGRTGFPHFSVPIILVLTAAIPILQDHLRIPACSEILYLIGCILCIAAIVSLATPSTTWGDGFKPLGLLILPPALMISPLLYHQIRLRALFGFGKLVTAVAACTGCLLVYTKLPQSDYAHDSDQTIFWIAINATVFQLLEGIAALTSDKKFQ